MALRLTLDENIDCLAFCPASNFENLLVAGTYQLDENTGLRSGRYDVRASICTSLVSTGMAMKSNILQLISIRLGDGSAATCFARQCGLSWNL